MAVRFAERLGTAAPDTLVGGRETVSFGLAGNDTLTSSPGSAYSVLIGGSGNDTYYARTGTTITLADNGGGLDRLVTSSLSPSANARTALIDGRHFVAVDDDTGESVFIIDFLQDRNLIEEIVTPEGTFTSRQIFDLARAQPSFLGDIAWEDLNRFGITQPFSSAETDEAIRFYGGRAAGLEVAASPSGPGDVFRFYNPDTGAHFFTASVEERNAVALNLPAYRYEGKAFESAPAEAAGTIDVFRFLNTETGTHFYTASVGERDQVIASGGAYRYEGEAYDAYGEAGAGRTALYRFYNADTGTHFYTASLAERDAVIATLEQYDYEGVGYYVGI